MTQLIEQFAARFAAGSPGFYVNTQEEARLDGFLAEIATVHGLHILEWNLGLGPVRFDNKQPLDSNTLRPELAAFLEWLRLDSQYEKQLIVIKNARLALDNDRHAIAKLRQLLNLIERHHAGKAAVLLVSESLQPPQEIEALLTQLKLPLPNLDEILAQIDQFGKAAGLEIPVHLRSQAATRLCGLDLKEIERVIKLVSRDSDVLDENSLKQMLQAKEQRIAQSGLLEMIQTNESLDDIGGLQNLKTWLARKSQILKRLPEAQKARIQLPKGCLIAGIPGCGKSLSAKVAAHEFGQPLLRLDIGAMLGKYVGESEHNMRRALALAEAVSPCVLWVDELEKAFVGVNSGASEVSARLLGNFLTWMQERSSPVFVIATANDVTITPPELLRKGRFDEIFYVGFPSLKERQDILSIHLRKLGQDGTETGTGWVSGRLKSNESTKEFDMFGLGAAVAVAVASAVSRLKEPTNGFDLSTLARLCRDFTGADIQNALNDALETAFLDGRSLQQTDLEAAIKQTVPLRVTLRDKIGEYEELFDRLKLTPASEEDEMSIARMSKWVSDENPIRRKAVAEHADCPDDLLEKLAEDAELMVRKAVLDNSSCPESVLAKRLAIKQQTPEYDHSLFELACLHQNAPLDLLHHLKTQGKLDKKAREIFDARAEKSNFTPRSTSETSADIVIAIPEKMKSGDLLKIVKQIESKMTPDMFRQLGDFSLETPPVFKDISAIWKCNDMGWHNAGANALVREGKTDWHLKEVIFNFNEEMIDSEEYRLASLYVEKKFGLIYDIARQFQLSTLNPLPENEESAADVVREFYCLFNTSDSDIRRDAELQWLAYNARSLADWCTTYRGPKLSRRMDTDADQKSFMKYIRADIYVCKDILSIIVGMILECKINVMRKNQYAYLDRGRTI